MIVVRDWTRVLLDGRQTARMKCPECEGRFLLADHEIKPDGTVVPSVDCPECDFHDHVQLEEWRSSW